MDSPVDVPARNAEISLLGTPLGASYCGLLAVLFEEGVVVLRALTDKFDFEMEVGALLLVVFGLES